MKTASFYLFSICLILLFNSCGSDEEINPDDQLIGTWKGGLTQPVFGVLETTLTITSLDISGSSGSGSSTCGDGIFEVTLVNENAIDVVWYQEAFPDNRASGRLTK